MSLPVRIHRLLIVFVACVLIFGSQAGAEQTIVDDVQGFTLTLPDDFVAKMVDAVPGIVHGFVLGDHADDQLDVVLLIEKMNGTIGREHLKQADMPPDFKGRLFTMPWQGFEVDGFEVPGLVGQTQTVTYNVQIPLKRAAIQIKPFGAADREAELKSLLTTILAGLKGESNWFTSVAPALPVTSSPSYGYVLLAFALLLVLAGMVLLWLLSRNAPKGTVLLIAIAVYCGGLALAGISVREIVMLSGALKMLGFAGGILGIVDILRRRAKSR